MNMRNTEGKFILNNSLTFRLKEFLKKLSDDSKVLVFCETKRGVDDLTKQMRYDGWHGVKGIHGDKT
jgi:ATP-dependent RNA helicase DDX5/DBP2